MKGRTEYCSSCGNAIPPWASGVCYVCIRIEKDYKRYGRRRPGRRAASGFEKKETKKRHRKKGGSGALSRKTRRAKRQRQGNRRHKLLLLPPTYEEEYAVEVRSYRLLRLGINRLLRAIYGERQYFSQILQRRGFDRQRVRRLRTEHLEPFLRRFVAAWRWWMEQKHLPSAAVTLLNRHYSLDGNRSEPLSMLSGRGSNANNSSAEQVWYRALRELRRPKHLEELELLVADVARHTLGDI